MRSIVLHIDDDVCATNGKDPQAQKLIEVAKTYGRVETLDSALASERARSQGIIDGLTAQLEAIKEFGVTPEELKVLKALREKSKNESVAYESALKKRDDQLEAIKVENENRAAAIKAMFGL